LDVFVNVAGPREVKLMCHLEASSHKQTIIHKQIINLHLLNQLMSHFLFLSLFYLHLTSKFMRFLTASRSAQHPRIGCYDDYTTSSLLKSRASSTGLEDDATDRRRPPSCRGDCNNRDRKNRQKRRLLGDGVPRLQQLFLGLLNLSRLLLWGRW